MQKKETGNLNKTLYTDLYKLFDNAFSEQKIRKLMRKYRVEKLEMTFGYEATRIA